MTYPLPQPTTDLDLAKRHLDEYGYCLLKDALSPEEVDVLRSRVLEQLEAEMQLGVNNRVRPDKKQLVKFLINKGRVFRDMIFHPGLHALLDHVLGTEYLLSSYHAHIAHPGSTKAFHTDQFRMPPPTNERKQTLVKPGSVTRARNRGHHVGGEAMIAPNTISPAVVCNAMWMLDEYTEANGTTLLVPGSHLSGRQPDHELDSNANWVPATGPAGTAVVFEGRTWCRVPQVSGISARPTGSVARRVPAGNGGPIAKGRNAATGSVRRALREFAMRATAALWSLPICPIFPADHALH